MADVARITGLWAQARTAWGADMGSDNGENPWLFGAFGAADIMFAPVCTRIDTYHLPVDDAARTYVDAVLAHPFMAEWRAAAMAEDHPFTRYDIAGRVRR